MGIEPTLQTLAKCSNHRATANSSDERLICWTASSLLFFFAKLLHAKPKDASGTERLICWTASSLLFFFAKLLHAKPKDASCEKRGFSRLVSMPYCNHNVVVCNRAG